MTSGQLYDVQLSILVSAKDPQAAIDKLRAALLAHGYKHAPTESEAGRPSVVEHAFELLSVGPFK